MYFEAQLEPYAWGKDRVREIEQEEPGVTTASPGASGNEDMEATG